ncbi:bacteriophage abortive infection AbiH family protein [Shewanella spartinae]|uniref:bacteriophage abortive infection AbiH family protein n=1 Tax=Shewanella spartinae TaxID=2864205 RepID=UPI001C6611EF|nr:bacteriophage abortive infection AbiH family protein [Shewanella spartinae]QYJ93117.1 bacteriophage abortive infection AbiH family protein [Shewanella spartinae]
MSKLYIIGNGFDLHHDLPTSLVGFRSHYKYSAFSRLYENGVFMMSSNQSLDEHWKHLEENLANFDVDEVIEQASEYYDDDPHENQFIYEVENIIDALTKGLTADLNEYLSLAEIHAVMQDKILNLDTSARFLCFNYTNTLERIYNISPDRICYIHGKLNSTENPIVIGHGMEGSEYTPPPEIDISALSEEQVEVYSESYSPDYDYAISEAHGYFKRSYKDTAACIKASSQFFQSLSDIESVIILGHSLSEIDQCYFDCVNKIARPNSQWWATYYSNSEKNEILERLEEIVEDHNRINLIEMSQLIV